LKSWNDWLVPARLKSWNDWLVLVDDFRDLCLLMFFLKYPWFVKVLLDTLAQIREFKLFGLAIPSWPFKYRFRGVPLLLIHGKFGAEAHFGKFVRLLLWTIWAIELLGLRGKHLKWSHSLLEVESFFILSDRRQMVDTNFAFMGFRDSLRS